jgi:3-phenylpropionate/trans-cinnamate dioxygenase ferredoxin reductase component
MNRIVIAGAGLADGRTCEQLRRQGFTGEIVLLGSKPHAPYDRAPLSKDVLHSDLVVAGVGVRQTTEWLAGSLPRADSGVIVDEHLEATAGIVALGDVAARWSPRYQRRLRFEHWDKAATAARVAAAAVLDRTIDSEPPRLSFDLVPCSWSDQFGCKLQFADVAGHSDSVVWRRDHGTRSRSAAWVDGTGRMTAQLTINAPAETAAGRRALAVDGYVHAGRLSDPPVPLADRDRSPTSSVLGVSALPFDPDDDRS